MNKLVAIAGGSTVVYGLLAGLMGVLPGIELSKMPPSPSVQPLKPIEARGREIYVSEGCSYCHTQQVRPLPADKVFGRPSAPGDFAFNTPQLLGSERTGPDLTNIGARQASDTWHYLHLYDPRAVVSQSIMPSYRWLFTTAPQVPPGAQSVPVPKAYAPTRGVVIPTEDARALVAYLLSLKQPALSKEPSLRARVNAPTVAAQGAAPNAASATPPASASNAAVGAKLFASICAACHGSTGAGVPSAFPPLAGDPVVTATDPTEQITVILHGAHGKTINGVAYAAQMPAFASQLSDAEIAGVINYERTSWGNQAPTVAAADVAAVRAKK